MVSRCLSSQEVYVDNKSQMVLGLLVVSSSTFSVLAMAVLRLLLLRIFTVGHASLKPDVHSYPTEIFESGFLRPRPRLTFGYMEVRVDKRSLETGKQITYLYNFRQGRSMSSYGTT